MLALKKIKENELRKKKKRRRHTGSFLRRFTDSFLRRQRRADIALCRRWERLAGVALENSKMLFAIWQRRVAELAQLKDALPCAAMAEMPNIALACKRGGFTVKQVLQRMGKVEALYRAHQAGADLPDREIEILPGAIRYQQWRVNVTGKARACIEEFQAAGSNGLDWEALRTLVWGADAYTERNTIKNAVKDARGTLRILARKAGQKGDDFDPLPCIDERDKLAWRWNFRW
jgi:hypothetical protein